jgi:glycosyltransferase involved in cell wall biosynthesis
MTSATRTRAHDPLRFIVLQPGARRHYAVPAMLARAGMLERFYTDICADAGLLRHLGALWPECMRPRPVARLLGRQLPPDVSSRTIRQVPLSSCAHLALRRFPSCQRWLDGWVRPENRMIDLVRSDGFAGANALYTVLVNSDLDLVREAKGRGVRTVHDVMMAPDIGRWAQEERQLFPGIEETLPPERVRAGNERDARKYQLSDLILVPSEFVRRAVLELGADPTRIATVPYGIDERWLDQVNELVPGRVLFVGSARLLKGSHYLAAACRILQRRHVPCEVRVVGPCRPDVVRHPAFRGPTYVGQVPRSRIADEFRRADVFVLPTLSEGMARAHLEAMACGVPVITTPNCGAVVRDGVDGFVVPIRDAKAIADKVELLLADRGLRERMGQSARERARVHLGALWRASAGRARRAGMTKGRLRRCCSSAWHT